MNETFNYPGCVDTVWVKHGKYPNGRDALQLVSRNGVELKATCNVIEYPDLPEDHLLIKVWAENRGMMPWLLAHGIVVDAGVNVPAGMVWARLAKKGPHFPYGAAPKAGLKPPVSVQARTTWCKRTGCDRWDLCEVGDGEPKVKVIGRVERIGLNYEARDRDGVMIGKRSACYRAQELVEQAERVTVSKEVRV